MIKLFLILIFINSFITQVVPQNKPKLLSPGKAYKPGELVTIDQLIFKWEKVENAKGYRIFISKRNRNGKYLLTYSSEKEGLIKNTFYKPEGLQFEENSEYSWGIRAYSDSKWGTASNSFYIKIKPKPKVPVQPDYRFPGITAEPGQQLQGDNIYLNWNKVQGADGYAVYISQKDSNDTYNLIFNSAERGLVTDTFLVAPKTLLTPNTLYRWNIRSYNKFGWSNYSKKNYFQIGAAPAIRPRSPNPVSPGSSTESEKIINTLTPTFTWNKFPLARSYELIVSEKILDSAYKKIYDSKTENSVDTTYNLPPGLLNNDGVYQWQVRALFPKDSTTFSNSLFFKVNIASEAKVIIQSPQNALEEIFITLKYADLINSTIVSYYSNGKIFLPVGEMFSLLEINNKIDYNKKTVNGFYLSPEKIYMINLTALKAEIFSDVYPFSKEEFIVSGFDYYFSPDFYKRVFDIDLFFDLSSLTVTVNSKYKMPVYERASRERSYRYLLTKKENYSYKLFDRKRELINFGMFDYNISTTTTKYDKPSGSFQLGLGGEVLGGDLQMMSNGIYYNSRFNSNQNEFSWRYVFDKNDYVSYAALGFLDFDGLGYTGFKGIKLSNTPLEPRSFFSSYKVFDNTNPNWTVEFYINNQLIDQTKADATGNFSFDLPLGYGTTLVQMKFYGPGGEYYARNKLYQVPFYQLKPREFNYLINIGKQRYSNDNLASISGGFGISDWLTNKVGIEYLENSNNDRPVFYNSTTARIGGGNLVNLTLAPNTFYSFASNTLFYSQASIDLKYTNYLRSGIFNQSKVNNEYSGQLFIPFNTEHYQFNIQSGVSYLKAEGFKRLDYSLGTSLIFSNLNSSAIFRYSKVDLIDQTITSPNLDIGFSWAVLKLPPFIKFLKGNLLTARGYIDIKKGEFQYLTLSFATNIFENSRLQISHSNNFINSISNTQVQLVIYFPFTQYSTSVSSNVVTQNFSGSIGYDKNLNKLNFFERQHIGKSAVSFRIFVDENGNDKYDYKEKLINDAFLNMGTSVIRKDDKGTIGAHELNPYTRYDVNIIEDAIKDPSLKPKMKRFSIITDPNSFKLIDVPFYTAGEISGFVFKETNAIKNVVAGIKIQIMNLADSTSYTTTTFSNGSFYYFGIMPGSYKIFVDKEQCEILGLKSDPAELTFDIEVKQNGDSVDNLEFVLRK